MVPAWHEYPTVRGPNGIGPPTEDLTVQHEALTYEAMRTSLPLLLLALLAPSNPWDWSYLNIQFVPVTLLVVSRVFDEIVSSHEVLVSPRASELDTVLHFYLGRV